MLVTSQEITDTAVALRLPFVGGMFGNGLEFLLT